MRIKSKNKCRRFLSFLVALCLTVGLVPLMPVPAQAANYWDGWTELGASPRTLTGTNNFKVTSNTTITPATGAGNSSIVISSGTTTIYIASDVTLTVSGRAGSGTTGGGAGIRLVSGATLILRGDGTVNATGGNAANGTNGLTGVSPYHTAQQNIWMSGGGSGSGGAGAGAGIGGNGGNGGAGRSIANKAILTTAVENGLRGNDGSAGGAMGTLYILDSVRVNATGGASGTQGSGGVGGANGGSQIPTVGGVWYWWGSGGGGGGGRGVRAANIGGGGGGGGSGGTGGYPSSGTGISQTNANAGSGGAPFGNPGTGGAGSGSTAGAASGGAAVGTGGRGGNVGEGGTGGTVHVASTVDIGNLGGGTRANGEGGAASTQTISALTVTYNGNNHTGGLPPVDGNIYYDNNLFNTATVLGNTGNLVQAGHEFIGWNTSADGSGTAHAVGSTFTITADTTLFAQWSSTFNAIAIVDDEDAPNFDIDSANLEYVLNNYIVTENDRLNGNSVTLTLTVTETNDTAEGAEQILDGTRGRLMQFFDITVTKTVNNNDPVTLTELPVPIQITIDLSEDMSRKSGYTVYRFHDGEVQLLGMDTDADEYFTVRRGGGKDGVDQVVIYARNFSTYAVVENILTMDGLGSDDVDVQARIVDLTTPVYRIDIAWGEMKFIYNLTASAGTWNPETASYDNPVAEGWSGFEDDNNQVIVSNHSNADVLVSLAMTEIGLTSPVTMELFTDNSENGTPATNLPLGMVPRNRAELEDVESISAYLRLKGTPNEEDIARLDGDVWHRIGIITVTITPDGDVLTPLR